jgi:hypothetical protein
MGAQNKIPSLIKRFHSTPMSSIHLRQVPALLLIVARVMYGKTRESSYDSKTVFFLTFDIFDVIFIFIFIYFVQTWGPKVIAIDTGCSVHMSDEAYLTMLHSKHAVSQNHCTKDSAVPTGSALCL